jgi:hypothetical protein
MTQLIALLRTTVVRLIAGWRRKARSLEDRRIIADHAESLEMETLETLEFQATPPKN